MKKAILYVFLAPLLFYSCSKEHKTTPITTNTGGKTYKVQFNLSGFTQKISSINNKKQPNSLKTYSASPDSSNTDSLDILYYLVYDYNGNLVHEVTETSDSANFANFSDNLPASTYSVYFIAGKTGLLVNTAESEFYYSAPGDYLGDWHDTFFQSTQVTVTGDVSENVTLDRFVSAIKININDAIPANAAKIVTTIGNEYTYYQYVIGPSSGGYSVPYTKTLTSILSPASIGKTNFQQYTIMAGNTSVTETVIISCYDASNNLIGNAVIPNVRLVPNKEIILAGNLFGPSGTNNLFQVAVNNTWDPNPFTTISF